MTKSCSKCNVSFDETCFLKGRSICKGCRATIRKEKYIETKENATGTKDCNACGETKDVSLFKVGTNKCNDCFNELRRKDRIEAKKTLGYNQITVPEGYKLCKLCFTVKNDTEFRHNRLKCKKCENIERVAYKNGTIEKYEKHDVLKEDDFEKRLKASSRFRIRECLPLDICNKITDENRFGYIYEFIGCDFSQVKKWLQYNYTEDMNDDNYGSIWNMDHVIPISLFDIKNNYEKNKKNCFSWFNLSPIQTKHNFEKQITIDTEQLERHVENYKTFCGLNDIVPDENYLLLCATHLGAGTS